MAIRYIHTKDTLDRIWALNDLTRNLLDMNRFMVNRVQLVERRNSPPVQFGTYTKLTASEIILCLATDIQRDIASGLSAAIVEFPDYTSPSDHVWSDACSIGLANGRVLRSLRWNLSFNTMAASFEQQRPQPSHGVLA